MGATSSQMKYELCHYVYSRKVYYYYHWYNYYSTILFIPCCVCVCVLLEPLLSLSLSLILFPFLSLSIFVVTSKLSRGPLTQAIVTCQCLIVIHVAAFITLCPLSLYVCVSLSLTLFLSVTLRT